MFKNIALDDFFSYKYHCNLKYNTFSLILHDVVFIVSNKCASLHFCLRVSNIDECRCHDVKRYSQKL